MSTRAAGVLAGLVLALAGCGGDDASEPSAGEGGEQATVTVAVLPIAPTAPLFLGIEKGFFEDEKLRVEPQTGGQGGAANLTSVVSGDVDVGFSDVVSQLIALDKGLEIQAVAETNAGGSTPKDTYSAVMVPEESPIEAPEDLAGKTIATNALNNISDVTIKGALDKRGVDVSGIQFTEVPLPQTPTAAEKQRVDAALVIEPFIGLARSKGLRPVLYNYVETIPQGALATYFVSQRYLDQNRDVVERFARAMNTSTDYAASHPEEVRKVLGEYTEIPAPVAKQMVLPVFGSNLGDAATRNLAELLKKYGLIENEPDLEKLRPLGS